MRVERAKNGRNYRRKAKSKKSVGESTKGRQKIANCEKGRWKGEEGTRWGKNETGRIGVAYCEGYIHAVRSFVLVITICALSDAAHSFSGRCARGCCISLHRESNRFVRFSLISAYHGSTYIYGRARGKALAIARTGAIESVFNRVYCISYKSPGKVLFAKLGAVELFTRDLYGAVT